MHCNKSRRGFIESRTLIAIFITLSILPLLMTIFKYCADLDFDYEKTSSELTFVDLRRVLLLAYDLQVNENELDFIYHGSNYKLSLVNNKLLLQPGSQIYLNDIEDLSFKTSNGCVYVLYTTIKGKEYERVICKEKGIYLNDFLDNNDELFEFDDGDV